MASPSVRGGSEERRDFLQHLDGGTGQPDIELAEAPFELFFEGSEEGVNLFALFSVHINPDEIIPKALSAPTPAPMNNLGLAADCSETILQFLHGLGKEGLGHRFAVIEPQRNEDLVASPVFHKRRNRRS